MDLTESTIVWSAWLTWLLFWVASARGGKPVAQRESDASRRGQGVPMLVGGLLLAVPRLGLPGFDAGPHILEAAWCNRTGYAALALGLLFTVWARRHLGTNWSVSVTLKHDHALVHAGPYAWVRHPIYSGALLAILGTALVAGAWRSGLGLALVAASLLYKIRLEERWLLAHFGEPYRRYQARVPALVPAILPPRLASVR